MDGCWPKISTGATRPGSTRWCQPRAYDHGATHLRGDLSCRRRSARDYKPWNALVRDGQIAAVLDWEFAFAGAPLNDIGNFLRYQRPPTASLRIGLLRRLPRGRWHSP